MAVAKKVAKKVGAAKSAPIKKSAKAVKAVAVETPKRPGRPPGPIHVPDWIDVIKTTPMGRLGSLPGIGSTYLRAGAEGAKSLEILAELIRNKDPRLVKLLKPPKQ